MKEHDKASAWAAKRKLSTPELGVLTGYSRQAVYWFLRGEAPAGKGRKTAGKIAPDAWKRFKLCCAAVEAKLKSGREFNW